MTTSEIITECHRIEAAIAEKGYYSQKVTAYINWIGYELTINIEYRADAHSVTKDRFFNGKAEDGFDALFAKADAFVSGLKSIQDAKRDAFIAAVGKLIDHGRDIGMEVEFLNPLTSMMGKLSTNIITKERNE
jgi:predicted Co/Zn/Cd cation transporter (cation efflux family)